MGIICIQEHWLYKFQQPELYGLFPNTRWAVKSVDDNDHIPPKYRPRGQAGVACAWHPHIDHLIKILPDGSDRLLALLIKSHPKPIVLVNTYMPAAGTHTGIRYSDIIDEVHEVLQKYRHNHHVLWAGDLNGDPARNTYPNDRTLIKFCSDENLTISPEMPETPTFHHFNGTSKSRIDLLILPKELPNLVNMMDVDRRHPTNTSCHDAVIAHLSVGPPPPQEPKDPCASTNKPVPRRIKWEKVDTIKYQTLTGHKLSTFLQTAGDDLPAEIMISRINSILTDAAEKCCPKPKKPGKPKSYKWDPQMKPLVKESKHLHYKLQQSKNEASSALIKQNLLKAKKDLRRMQKQISAEERNARHREIMEASEDDHSLFYRLVRRQRADGPDNFAEINFKFDPDGVNSQVENWATYFQDLATPKQLPQFDQVHEKHMRLKRLLLQMLSPPAPQ